MAEPAQILEVRAAEQRRQLHDSVIRLRSAVKDKLDVKKNAREYIIPASAIIAGLGLVAGWVVMGFALPAARRRKAGMI